MNDKWEPLRTFPIRHPGEGRDLFLDTDACHMPPDGRKTEEWTNRFAVEKRLRAIAEMTMEAEVIRGSLV